MNIFDSIFVKKPKANKFNLTHDVKTSFQMGRLIPTMCMEVLPGDKFNFNAEGMFRFMPLVSPAMHRIRVEQAYFFVPNRILWGGWEDFITGNDPNLVHPYYITDELNVDESSIQTYMGVPTGVVWNDQQINAFPMLAYNKVFNEYYRDENLVSPKYDYLAIGGGADLTTHLAMPAAGDPYRPAWRHDYFTGSLPFAQKGDAVTLPLTNNEKVPVDFVPNSGNPTLIVEPDGTTSTPGAATQLDNATSGNLQVSGFDRHLDPNGNLEVDINEEAVDINTLRRAFRLQEWLEKNARAGTRYVESVLAHFGVRSSDARLQRPEFIGSHKGNMVISEVLSTAQTIDGDSNDVPIGQMGGHGINVTATKNMRYRAEEHGYIIGLTYVRPETAYQQGLSRQWSRADKFDYAWPEFAHIGEQEVKNQEVYAEHASPDDTFGYVPRYSEYRFQNNMVTGKMQTDLSYWHLGRIFSSDPSLNENFIQCAPDTRIFADQNATAHHIVAHILNKVDAHRVIPRWGIPSI